jgi:TonB family protein
MNILFIYMIKVSVYLTAFYAIYSILLSMDTSYMRNRFFILSALTTSLILPFISFHTSAPHNYQVFGKVLSDVFVSASGNGAEAKHSFLLPGFLQTVYSIYIIVAAVFILKFFIDLINLQFLILKHKNEGSRIIRFHGFSTSGFSAMGYVFINTRLSPEDAGEIIRHEQNHLKQNHFVDIIIIEIVKAFQWFNPFVYFFDRSLRAVHEFQADEECISSGIPIASYQSLLLCQVFKSKAFNLSNSFSNPSMIRKRMIMMTKKRTPGFANIKLLSVLPVIAFVSLTISAYTEFTDTDKIVTQNSFTEMPPPPPPPPANTESKDISASDEVVPFVTVEEMPHFPGEEEALMNFIRMNTNYPQSAKKNNIQGKVVVRFCVTETGGVSKISILKGVSSELDNEAMRVVSKLPTFKPGMQGGKPVPVWYMVPIQFTLQ